MRNDDCNHSDWLVGAGLDPAIFYAVVGLPGSPAEQLDRAARQGSA